MISRCAHNVRGSSRISVANTARSEQSNRGGGLLRRNTATSWRNTSNSASFDAEERPSKTNQAQTRVKISYSRRNESLDHLAPTPTSATPQVTPRQTSGAPQVARPSHAGGRREHPGEPARATQNVLHRRPGHHGVPLRDRQYAMRHADARATMPYHRARDNLDRHAAHSVAAYLAGMAVG
ncbi:MAG: hypothetical protein ACYDAQ_18470 [Mycobacteriales bacterium]